MRKKRILSYAKGLEKTAEGHQQLYQNRNHLSDQAFRSLLREYINDIEEVLADLRQQSG
jgi:hypothetical protein